MFAHQVLTLAYFGRAFLLTTSCLSCRSRPTQDQLRGLLEALGLGALLIGAAQERGAQLYVLGHSMGGGVAVCMPMNRSPPPFYEFRSLVP